MKKTAIILFAVFCAIACQKTENGATSSDVTFVTIESSDTKTQLGTNMKISWSEGDAISVFSDKSAVPAEFKLNSGEGYTLGSFIGKKPEGKLFYAYYPSTATIDVNGNTLRSKLSSYIEHSIPNEMLTGAPMFGSSETFDDIEVSNICGVLKINMKGDIGLSYIVLEAEKPISGAFACDLDEGTVTMDPGSSHIIYMEASGTTLMPTKSIPFYFVLPPGEYDELQLTVTDADDKKTEFFTTGVTVIEAGEISAAKGIEDIEFK